MPLLNRPNADAVPTILAEPLPDGSVRCGVCAHRCLVRPGRAGICGVRENRDGTLWCLAYGAVAAAGLDPIEKKPLFHVDPGSLAYSISTIGCPFHCMFCQNWEIAQAPRLGLDIPQRRMSPARIVEEAVRAGARSIAYTYVEPTVFLEYALDTGRLAREAGLRNLFVTDGYATAEAVGLLAHVLDAANVDLKSFDDAFYRRLCGARLAHVLDAIVAYRDAVEPACAVVGPEEHDHRAIARIGGTMQVAGSTRPRPEARPSRGRGNAGVDQAGVGHQDADREQRLVCLARRGPGQAGGCREERVHEPVELARRPRVERSRHRRQPHGSGHATPSSPPAPGAHRPGTTRAHPGHAPSRPSTDRDR
jgi:pyruvate-formate lyase-activating enzyme